jgi:hypothetical protein
MFRRLFVAAIGLAVCAAAAPSLTTVQDVLYKADGTLFSGTLTITWNSFQPAGSSGAVTKGSIVVKVTDGYLRVQLVPTTTAVPVATYTVVYDSDGRTQFRETWAVPSSTRSLHVSDVRIVASTSSTGAASDTSGSGTLTESSIVGLVADLNARAIKGPNFAAGSAAMVDGSGMLESVIGNATDCVHVDGSSGACGSTAPAFVDSDTLSGLVDGVNMSFGLSAAPSPAASLTVYRNGVLQEVGEDYSLSGSTIQFLAVSTPQPGDTLAASYRTAGSNTSSTAPTVTSPQVLCGQTGASTNSVTLATLGACTIAAGVLLPGDRVEVRFDLSHQGSAAGFSLELHWGATTVVHRDATAGETLVSGRGDAAVLTAGAQTSSQTWGSVLSFGATTGTASDAYANGLTITLWGAVSQSSDLLALTNFSVVRVP